MEYASKAVGNAALATGIIGTALGVIDGAGGLAGLFNRNSQPPLDDGDRPITRHDMELYQQINSKDNQITLLTAQKYTDNVSAGLQQQISMQNVWNATQTANIQCIQGQVAQLQSLTQLVVPNQNVSPGWGNVQVVPVPPFPPFPVPVTTAQDTNTTAATS